MLGASRCVIPAPSLYPAVGLIRWEGGALTSWRTCAGWAPPPCDVLRVWTRFPGRQLRPWRAMEPRVVKPPGQDIIVERLKSRYGLGGSCSGEVRPQVGFGWAAVVKASSQLRLGSGGTVGLGVGRPGWTAAPLSAYAGARSLRKHPSRYLGDCQHA